MLDQAFGKVPVVRTLTHTTAGVSIMCGLIYLISVVAYAAANGWPQPMIHDEFSYLLAAETYASGKVSMPAPPHPAFFETFHELTFPARASKYPVGQGLALAIGVHLGHPILGVWLSGFAFIVALVWAVSKRLSLCWSAVTGLLAVSLFGGGSYWSQSYWGGLATSFGGALVLGGYLRWTSQPTMLNSCAMGAGFLVLMHTRPFEGALLAAYPAALIVRDVLWRRRASCSHFLVVLLFVSSGVLLQIWINSNVTGSLVRMPYLEYEERYHSAPVVLWQRNHPTAEDIPMRMLRFDEEVVVPLSTPHGSFLRLWIDRVGTNIAVFVGLPLALIMSIALLLRGVRDVAGVWWMVAICWISIPLTYGGLPHYQAPASAMCVLLAVRGVRVLLSSRLALSSRTVGVLVLAAHGGWLLVGANVGRPLPEIALSMEQRANLERDLQADGSRNLVFVDYDQTTSPHVEWVFNHADLASAPTIWARDRGSENEALVREFPDRRIWLVKVFPDRFLIMRHTAEGFGTDGAEKSHGG